MIKVFLVEDEVVIRNGIKNSINWKQEGLEFVGEASDGELAYPMICKQKPDILITDIKMPFMDGIELSELVHKELPNTKIIILSGYGEFTYAQRAIRIGIEEYLLKPISSVKLLEAIKNVATQIEKERDEKKLLEKYSFEIQENIEHMKLKFFSRLVSEEMSIGEVLKEGKLLHMDLIAEIYCVIFFKAREVGDEMGYSENVINLLEEVEEYVGKEPGVYFYGRSAEDRVFILLANSEDEMKRFQEEFCARLVQFVKKKPQLEYFGSVGQVVRRISELKKSYYDANKKYSLRFIESWNQIIAGESKRMKVEDEDVVIYAEWGEIKQSREIIEKFLKEGTQEETEEFMEGYLDNINHGNLESLMFRQYITMDILFTLVAFQEKLASQEDISGKEEINLQQMYANIDTIEKTKNYLIKLIVEIIQKRDTIAGKKYSDIMDHARTYIQENYMQDSISLNMVASQVNMSPSYFSSLFGKEEGETFVEYLTEIRMEKAKELLRCSSMKTSEIGYEVGYRDPHYFSYIFKKTQKCTPKEYRTRGRK